MELRIRAGRRAGWLALLLLVLVGAALPVARTPGTARAGEEAPQLALGVEPVVTGLDNLVLVRNAGDGRLFVVDRNGVIWIVEGEEVLPQPFLDISGRVCTTWEGGLLGLAFHPEFADNGEFYVYYTTPRDEECNTSITSRISRFYLTPGDADDGDEDSEELLIALDQPAPNHNGGDIHFGPDGYLYIALGDGGPTPDYAQDLGNLFGAILRIDVDSGAPYAIPEDNPFAGEPGAGPCGYADPAPDMCSEIWVYGLRNPWRFSFDRVTGDMYIGDVGQVRYEEIDFQPASSSGGENYGWPIMEGFACYDPPDNCDQTGLTLPIHAYNRDEGWTLTGGNVYRGSAFPEMVGHYLYADFSSGVMWSMTEVNGEWVNTGELTDLGSPSSFGEDADGELYLTSYGGTLYRVVEESPVLAEEVRLPFIAR